MKTPVLIDLDGVLRSGNKLLPGAAEFLIFLKEEGIPTCILSNSTKFSADEVKYFFTEQGIEIDLPIITALEVTKRYLLQHYKSAVVYAIPSAKKQLKILPEENPEVVVVGDLADGWSYNVLNEMLRHLMNGAELLAMQKNAIGKDESGHYLDAGSFIAALEYASGKKAKLLGKPSTTYFNQALALLGSSTDQPFIMLGDDLKVDIAPAIELGAEAILLLTGKTTLAMISDEKDIRPTQVCENLAEVISYIKHHG